MNATIYHNPRCSKSRKALALLADAGAVVRVVDYPALPPTRKDLARLFARAGLSPRDGLRCETPAAARTSYDAALDAMAADPTLIERPLVKIDKRLVLARPLERIRYIV